MNSSLMNNTKEAPIDPGVKYDTLLEMCLNPQTHHDEIRKSLLALQACQEKLKHSANYWLLCSLATEIHRPHSAPRYMRYCLNRAYSCDDFDQHILPYAEWRVEALQGRVKRSSASISNSLRDCYERRLTQAMIDLDDIRANS